MITGFTYYNNFSSVCKSCSDRCIGCHGKCKKYLDERYKRDEQIKKRNADRYEDYIQRSHYKPT